MSQDALDRVFRPWGKKARQDFARKKSQEEESKAVDPRREICRRNSAAYEEHVRRERLRLGLEPKEGK
jgi:hypothetical protein